MKHPNQLFVDVRDQLIEECMLEELYYSMISRHDLHVLNQTPGTDLYGDPVGEPSYDRTVNIPIYIHLDPQVNLLLKYGIDQKRDALVWFSRKICRDNEVLPKIGDRIDFTYRTPSGAVINEHFILTNVSPWDFQRQLIDYYGLCAAAERTQLKYKPDPTGTPSDPKSLPFDTNCLK